MIPSDGASAPAPTTDWLRDPAPLEARGNALFRWLGPAISLSILVVVLMSLRALRWDDVRAVIPTTPAFWLVFFAYYFTPVLADWSIFRYLWGIPASGFVALLRKLVSNELLFGYIGEVYFYTWARKKLAMSTSPFGAVKDTAILSALAGNAVTLAMMAAAFPLMNQLQFHVISDKLRVSDTTLMVSIGAVVAIPLLAVVFGNRLFSLSRRQLWVVAAINLVRIAVTLGLAALAWAVALPQVKLGEWVVLSTVRLIISRLPFVTQKDIVFAGIAVMVVGHDHEIAALITFWAAIQLMAHLGFGLLLAIGYFMTEEDKR